MASQLQDRFRGLAPVGLACLIWVVHALVEMASLGKFFWLAVVWAVHGLILMLIMTALLDQARSRPRILYWAAVLVLPVLFTLAQSWLDLWFVYHLSVPTKIETLFDNSMVKSGAATTVVQNFKVYIWLFGFYAAVIALLDAAHSSYEARLEVKVGSPGTELEFAL